MLRHIKFTVLFLSLVVPAYICGQEQAPIQNFLPKDYRAETQTWAISQSADKSIYAANNSGLLVFNGVRWRLYPSPNNTIMRSVSVQGERIYTGCYMEFGYWVHDGCLNLKYTSLSSAIKDKLLEDEHFWGIYSYRQWMIFQSLHRIYLYDTQNHSFKIINSEHNLPKVFVANDQIYFQKLNGGVFELRGGVPALISDFPVFRNNVIINIFPFESSLLVQTQERGFYVLDKGKVSPWKTDAAPEIDRRSIYSSLRLSDGNFALGTVGDGLYILSPDGKIIHRFNKINGLQNNTVLSIFQDAGQNIWLGLDNGISVINYNSPFRKFTDADNVFGSVYAAALHHGNLYLGTNQGLFYRPAHSNGGFQPIPGTQGQVWMLKIIDSELFCGHTEGTFIVSGTQVKPVCREKGAWDIKPVPHHPELLLQGNYQGLNVLEKKNGLWQYRNKVKGIDISSRFIEWIDDSHIFVNHEYKGLYELELSADLTRVVNCERNNDVPVGSNSGIAAYKNKLLYFVDKGLYEYDFTARKFIRNEKLTKQILSDDLYVSGKMINDNDRRLWVFTRNNLTAVTEGTINSEPHLNRIALSLPVHESLAEYGNLLNLGGDICLLGTADGYITFNSDRMAEKDYHVKIFSIQKSDKKFKKQYLPVETRDQKLKWSENNIQFAFAVPVFDKFSVVGYQYKLEGIYDEWTDWSIEPQAVFGNLPPGSYTFRVRAKAGNKVSKNIASYHFSVANPWYTSWWMTLVYIALFIFILYLINRANRIIYEKKAAQDRREKLLEQLKNEQDIITLKNHNLNSEIESVNRELAATNMAVVKKNEILNAIRLELQQGNDSTNIKSALKIIRDNMDDSSHWDAFEEFFNKSDRDFLKKIKELHPALTPNDLKLCVYLRLNLSSKEIAPLLNISPQSVEVKRFRLRKKMELNRSDNLTDYILGI